MSVKVITILLYIHPTGLSNRCGDTETRRISSLISATEVCAQICNNFQRLKPSDHFILKVTVAL